MMIQPQDNLAQAVEAGDLEETGRLLDRHPDRLHRFVPQMREWGEELWLPLHRAALHGHGDLVTLLLERGARPDARTRFQTPFHARATALHLAAAGGFESIMQMLIDAGAEVNVLDTHETSPLAMAARYGRAESVRLLIRHHALLEQRDREDRTPLHLAILADHAGQSGGEMDQSVAALVELGADLNATCPREPEAFTPLHRCVSMGLSRLGAATVLLREGADASIASPQTGHRPMELARADPQLEPFVKLLQRCG